MVGGVGREGGREGRRKGRWEGECRTLSVGRPRNCWRGREGGREGG